MFYNISVINREELIMETIKELLEEFKELDNDFKNGWSDFWKPKTWERYNYLVILLSEMGLI